MPQSWIPIDEQDPFNQVYGDLKKELFYEFNDLIDQRGAHDFILVDGHALVSALLSKESYGTIVDIENTQVLHFVHTLERFLLNIIERTVRFSIFFFESPSFLEYENPLHQSIARFFELVAYHHLKKNRLTTGIEVEKFPSWRSNEFSVFLSETRPSFIFGKRVPEKKEDKKFYTTEYEQFVLDLIVNKDFVFCHSVKISKNVVYGFCSNAMGAFKGKEAVMKFISEHAPKETTSKKIDFENQKMKKIMDKIQNEKSDDLSDPATKIVILALANQLIQNPMPDFALNVALAKLFLLSVVIKNNIEFKLRLQSLKNIPDAEKTITPFYHAFIDSLHVIVTDEKLKELVQSASLIDLYDTRLMQRCLIILKEKKDLIPNNFFQMLESYFSDFDKKKFQDVIDSHFQEPEELAEEEKRPEYVCRSLMTDLFSEYFADCKVPQDENEFELDLADLGFDLDLESSNSKLEENENEDYAPKSYKEKQKTLKLEQRLHQYAESLGNIQIRRTIEALDEEALLKKEVDKKKRKSELIKLESFITKTSKRFNEIHNRISIFQSVLSKELENNKKKEKMEQHLEKLFKKGDEKGAKKEKGKEEEEEGEDAEEEQKLTFDDFKRMDASVVYSEELGGKSLDDRISLIDDTLNELEQILKSIWETDKQMSEISQEGDLDNLIQMRKDCENVLVDALKTKIEHVVEVFNKVPPATLEPYFSLFEMINICIELCIELNNTENKAKLAEAETKKPKSGGPKNKPPKKAMEKPKSKTDKKGDKKGEKEIEAYDVEKTFQRLIQVLCTIGARKYAERVLSIYAEKINPIHKLALPAGKEFIKSHARFQLQFNQTHSSASRFLPDKETQDAKKKSEKEKQKQRYTKKDESKNLLDVSERMYGLGFEPEPWQRELIENVKKNNSALCVAPTSSGKTFIAFYVIEKILRESDDGVVVFVCPTRALVNQVYAEISSRFAKTYKYPQQNVIGMFHSFSRLNVLNSQVLITIPQSLEQLFISSAPNVMRWKKKLKYLILDEIHSISSETGEVWEHILLLAECPFVAMSATIGNPFEFRDWLNSNEEIKDQEEEAKKGKTEIKTTTAVELIMHRVRPRPLEFFVYEPGVPKPISEEEKKKQEEAANAPKIAISVNEADEESEEEKEEKEEGENEEDEEKKEEEDAEKAEEKKEESEESEDEEESDSEDEDKLGEQQQKFLEYALNQEKGQFVEIHPASVLNTQKLNANELQNMYTLSPSQCLSLYETFEKVKKAYPELKLSQKAEDLLIRDLCPETYFKDFGLIPRGEFQQYAIDMKESLIETEKLGTEHDKKFLTTCFQEIGKPVNESYQRQYTNFGKERISEEEFMIQNFVNVVESLKKGKMLPSLIFYFDNVVCTEMFNFLRAYLMRTKLNLWDNETEQLKAQKLIRLCVGQIEEQGEIKTAQDRILFSALELGIAVHHSSVPELYQIEVERLFRSRVLPIIICTGTLAFGVHLPCKSVVLCGNSLYMSKVLFEQCAGRAGRRGFDNKGKVVVYGCPQSKVNRLMTSDTPKIMGSMTLKIDFLVHLIRLYHFAPQNEKNGVKDSIISLLKQPLFILGRKYDNSSAAQTKYLMRHLVDFLVREEYITSKGKMTKYARMASSMTPQLFYPGNYVFIHLLKGKVIQKFLQNQEIEDGVKYEQLIILLCRLFGGVSMYMAPSEYNKDIELPQLHDALREGLEEYDNQLLEIFSSFASQYSSNEISFEKSLELVYTKQDFSKLETKDEKIPEELKEELESTAKVSQVKSPFVELSGESTIYQSIPQLIAESNPNMLIDLSHFPRTEWNNTFNGYVLAFWRNGDFKKTIELHNLKADSNIKNGLKFFLKALRACCTTIANLSSNESIVARYFYQLQDEYNKKFYQRDNKRPERKWGLSSLNTEAADMDLYGPKRTSKDSKRTYGDKFLNNFVDLEAMQRARKGKSFSRDDEGGAKGGRKDEE